MNISAIFSNIILIIFINDISAAIIIRYQK